MISKDEVLRIAALARLRLDEAEIERLQHDLEEILAYVDQLNEVDTDGVEPYRPVGAEENVLRDDIVGASLTQEEALGNAPERDGPFFKVPKVIDK